MEELMKQLEAKGLLNEEMLSELQKCSDVEEVMKLAKEKDVDCTLEQAQKVYDYYSLHSLSDDELEQVAGGGSSLKSITTCPKCGTEDDYTDDGFPGLIMARTCNKCGHTWDPYAGGFL